MLEETSAAEPRLNLVLRDERASGRETSSHILLGTVPVPALAHLASPSSLDGSGHIQDDIVVDIEVNIRIRQSHSRSSSVSSISSVASTSSSMSSLSTSSIDSNGSLKRRSHIRRQHRERPGGPRPLPQPPISSRPFTFPIMTNVDNYSPRLDPVSALPLTAFPEVPPTAITNHSHSSMPPLPEERVPYIDWDDVESMMAHDL